MQRAPRGLRRFGPALAVAAFGVLVLYRFILLGESLYWGDVYLYFLPLEHAVRQALSQGRLPLWNPYVLCGQPLIGNPQSWVFYPSTALLRYMPVWTYISLNSVIHIILAGLGAYICLRRVAQDRLGAALGACVYCGGGAMIARVQFPPMLQAMAYLPWLLASIDLAGDRPGVRATSAVGLVVLLELLAAHSQVAYMTLVVGSVYAILRIAGQWGTPARMWAVTLTLAGGLAVGLLGCLVQALPALQLVLLSTREHLTLAQANRFTLRPEQLLGLVWPGAFGSPTAGNYFGSGNIWEPCVYIGILPIGLSLFAIWRVRRRKAVAFHSLLAIVCLWLAMGRTGGLYTLAFYLVPGVSAFHDPARFIIPATLGLGTLTAIGMRELRDLSVSRRIRYAIAAVAILDIWWFSAHLNPTISPGVFAYRPRALAVTPSAGEGRVYTVRREAIWGRYLNYSDYGPDSSRYAHELTDTLSPNVGMRFGVEEAGGYEPVPLQQVTEVDGLVRNALAVHSPNLVPLLTVMNARVLLLPEAARFHHPGIVTLRTRGTASFRVSGPGPRAWLVNETVALPAREVPHAMARAGFDPLQTAILSSTDGRSGNRCSGLSGSLEIAPRPPGATMGLRAHVSAGPQGSFLVWSATAYPGWRVTMDGEPGDIVRTNHAFVGCVVPPGRHEVRVSYQPASLRIGLFALLLSISAILGGFAAHAGATWFGGKADQSLGR